MEHQIHIWVDGDACPKAVKEILFKAAVKRSVQLTLVANQYIALPKSSFLTLVQVAAGFDIADNYIADNVEIGDLVITADIPLAAAVVAKGAFAIEPRGRELNEETIAVRLATRNLMEELRTNGQISGGPSTMSSQDSQAFANTFDRILTRRIKEQPNH